MKQQKITLDEIKMNELFDEILCNYKMEYGNYGGAGCDFSISITNKKD
jgi:hypothetical protein